MKSKKILGIIALSVAMLLIGSMFTLGSVNNGSGSSASAETSATAAQSPFVEPIAKVVDSVVWVYNYQNVSYYDNYFGFGFGHGGGEKQTEERLYATGSGVVVAKEGYVLTNYHVVEGAARLEVALGAGKETYAAELVAADSSLDIAVLKVDGLTLSPVALGDSDSLQLGEYVFCIGNPYSKLFNQTVTSGIVSGLNRDIVTDYSTDKYGKRSAVTNSMIQTNADINSGNSGGGMFNIAGELVGIPTIKYSGILSNGSLLEGINMAIPINVAKPLIEQVVSGQVKAGTDVATGETAVPETETSAENKEAVIPSSTPRMGISVSDINAASSAVMNGYIPTGIFITKVEEGSPAEKSGLKVGDIIVEVDESVVKAYTEMKTILGTKNAGDSVALKVFRADETLSNDRVISGDVAGQYLDFTVGLEILDASNT